MQDVNAGIYRLALPKAIIPCNAFSFYRFIYIPLPFSSFSNGNIYITQKECAFGPLTQRSANGKPHTENCLVSTCWLFLLIAYCSVKEKTHDTPVPYSYHSRN
uniref:Uncharacterized protein n=1 Tax=Glossina pallidipes TaxID=7398 RepID=A0A1B0A9D6_GLOPL